MLSYKTTLACAFVLIGSVSAGLIPTDVSNIGNSPIAQLVQETTPTGVVSAIASSIPADIKGSSPTEVVSEVINSVPVPKGVSTDAVSAIVGNVVSKPFPTDCFPVFTQLTELTCKFGSITVSPATNGISVPIAQAISTPSCSTSSCLHGEFVLIMVSPDTGNTQILQYMQPGMSCSSSNSTKPKPAGLSSSEVPAVEYLGPTSSGSNKHTLFLFPQPEDLDLSDFDLDDDSEFDLVTFAVKYGLGVPVAGSFFVAEKSGNLTNLVFGNGSHKNATHPGNVHNGTVIGGSRGNSTNGTLYGSFHHGNGTSNSTIHGAKHNGTSSGTNSSSSGTNSSSSSSGGSNGGSTGSSGSSSDSSSTGSSLTGNIPIPPSSAADAQDSASKSSAYVANFALAGFIALVSGGVLSL